LSAAIRKENLLNYLIMSIIFSAILAFALLMMGPLVGGILAFAIIAGCIFRGLYLLRNIHKKISTLVPDKDKAREVYEEYLREKDKTRN
jgi:predicted membrane protein